MDWRLEMSNLYNFHKSELSELLQMATGQSQLPQPVTDGLGLRFNDGQIRHWIFIFGPSVHNLGTSNYVINFGLDFQAKFLQNI